MTLKTNAYYVPSTNKTIIPVRETDSSLNVLFDAEVEGDVTGLSEAEKLEKAQRWFIDKYILEYSGQLAEKEAKQAVSVASQAAEDTKTNKLFVDLLLYSAITSQSLDPWMYKRATDFISAGVSGQTYNQGDIFTVPRSGYTAKYGEGELGVVCVSKDGFVYNGDDYATLENGSASQNGEIATFAYSAG